MDGKTTRAALAALLAAGVAMPAAWASNGTRHEVLDRRRTVKRRKVRRRRFVAKGPRTKGPRTKGRGAGADEGYRLRRIGRFDAELVETAIACQSHNNYVAEKYRRDVVRALRRNGWTLVGGNVVESKLYLRGYVARKGKVLVVAFRGTGGKNAWESLNNWLLDFRAIFLKRPRFLPAKRVKKGRRWRKVRLYKGVRAHRGFEKGWASLRRRIVHRVQKHRDCRVYVTGFSLGGALATLCSLDLSMNFRRQVTGVFFGSPRVGNKRFHALFKRFVPNTLRVANNADIVPRVAFDPRFIHTSKLLQVYRSGVLVPLKKIRGSVVRKRISVKNHDRGVYRPMLKKLLARVQKGYLKRFRKDHLILAAKAEQRRRNPVHKALKQAGGAVRKGAQTTGKWTKKTAVKTGRTLKKGAVKTGRWTKKTAVKTGKAVKKTGKAVGKTFKKGYNKVKFW